MAKKAQWATPDCLMKSHGRAARPPSDVNTPARHSLLNVCQRRGCDFGTCRMLVLKRVAPARYVLNNVDTGAGS